MAEIAARVRARTGLIAVSGGALLWGTTGVPVRIIQERTGLSPVTIGCLRLAVATLAVAFVFGRSGVRRVRAVAARHGWRLFAAGSGLAGYQALYFVGVQDVGVSISTLVSLAVAPVALTVWASIAARKPPTIAAALTVIVAVAGLTMVSIGPGSAAGGQHPVVGLIASLGSGLTYAVTTVVNHRIAADGHPVLVTGAASAIGAVVLVPFALAFGLRWPADGIASGWLVYIGVATTVVAYALFYTGLRSTSSETAGVLTLLEPLAAAVLAAIVLHERLTGLGIAGGALLLAAIAALYVREPERETPPAL
jgi:drug/metabolite transporter, DME family